MLCGGFETGAFIGPIIGIARQLRLQRSLSPPRTPHLFLTILRSAGSSAAVVTGIDAVGLVAEMWRREEVEWRYRSWRLLEDKEQLEMDQWSAAGVGATAIILATSGYAKALGWRGQVGSCGMGAAAGLFAHAVWRYGMKGEQFNWEDWI